MNKDTKVLLMAVVIILVALVSFNLSDLTGKVTEGSSMTVSPSVVNFGWEENLKRVDVDARIGSEAVRNRVYLYTLEKTRRAESILLDKTKSPSSMVSNYKAVVQLSLSVDLAKGKYYLGAKNKAGDDVLMSNYFTVQ